MGEIDRIIHGDASAILPRMPDDSVDIVVTSPPYNQLGKSRRLGHGWNKNPNIWKGRAWLEILQEGEMYPDDMPEETYQDWINQILQECLRVSKGLVWFNHKTRYRDGVGIHPLSFLKAPLYSEVIWACNGSIALNCKRFAPSHETIYGFGKPHFWNDNSNKLLSVWSIQRAASNGHPTNFPVEIPLRLMEASCPPGGIVLDPFLGSGTTAVAAIQTGRHYMGIEIIEKYCELSQRNVEDSYAIKELDDSQLDLFER